MECLNKLFIVVFLVSFLSEGWCDESTTEAANYQNLTLVEAIKMGDLEAVRYRVAAGDSVTKQGRSGNAAIHVASAYGRVPILQYLVEEQGVPVNTTNLYEYTPLDLATTFAQVEAMRYLVGRGANISAPTGGRSVLHEAAISGNLSPVKYLVDHGADVNGRDEYGESVLHYAASINYLPVVRFLVEHGADINAKSDDGTTPLLSACLRQERDDENYVLKYLVGKGADVKARFNDGATALHTAAYKYDLRSIQFLIEHGADLNARDNYGDTPLHYMASNSLIFHEGAIKYLVEHGADVGATNNDGFTPFGRTYSATPAYKFLIDPAL